MSARFAESTVEEAALLSGELRLPSPRLRQADVPAAAQFVEAHA
jgi:hypothetical protein